MKVKRIYEGKVFYRIEQVPWYSSSAKDNEKEMGYKENICLRYWKLPFGLYLSKRQLVKGLSQEMKDAIYRAAKRTWDKVKVDFASLSRFIVYILDNNNDIKTTVTYYQEVYKFFRRGEVQFTDDRCVVYLVDEKKYYGYSHRAAQGFGIGDKCFTDRPLTDKIIETDYCSVAKYRREFIKNLKYYHRKKDSFGFANLMRGGIMHVVPFKEKGSKTIETLEEAFQAAKNFSNYVS